MNKSTWWLAPFIILGLLLGLGVVFLVTRPPRGELIELLPAPTQSPIIVHISGAVGKNGLYSLPRGSRVNDAILAAGGFTDNADTAALNLAQILEDGAKVVVPDLVSQDAPENGTRLVNPVQGLVNINTATIDQLDSLPEIGPKTAQNIIDYRNANGPFVRIEDIQAVPDIGPMTYDKIKELITTGTSP